MFQIQEDTAILNALNKMSDSKKISFCVECIEHLNLAEIFNENDTIALSKAIPVIKSCLDGNTNILELNTFNTFMAFKVGDFHTQANKQAQPLETKPINKARSYAADAIYGCAEIVYHHLSYQSCAINIMHVLENIRLSQKWLDGNKKISMCNEAIWQENLVQKKLLNSQSKDVAQIIQLKEYF